MINGKIICLVGAYNNYLQFTFLVGTYNNLHFSERKLINNMINIPHNTS